MTVEAGFAAAAFWLSNSGNPIETFSAGQSTTAALVAPAASFLTPSNDFTLSRDGMQYAFNDSGFVWIANFWTGENVCRRREQLVRCPGRGVLSGRDVPRLPLRRLRGSERRRQHIRRLWGGPDHDNPVSGDPNR